MTDEEQLRELFYEHFHLDDSSYNGELHLDELAIDSLELLEFVVAAEELFDVDLDEEQLARCVTVEAAGEYILERARRDA